MKIYLDDVRIAPKGWIQTYTATQTIFLLRNCKVEEISLDHDLGDEENGTGYDVLKWIEEQVHVNNYNPPIINIHTANPVARNRMQLAVNAIKEYINGI